MMPNHEIQTDHGIAAVAGDECLLIMPRLRVFVPVPNEAFASRGVRGEVIGVDNFELQGDDAVATVGGR